ncbi:MAG: mechanosensitive ion channel domain-containing protein [Terrimicrobiaceae bacterium]
MSLPSVWLSALAGGLIFLTTVPGEGEEQVAATLSEQTTAQTRIHNAGIIAIPDVAARATEVADLIRESNAKLASGAEIKAIDESLPDTARLIDLEAWMTTQMLRQQPTLDSLERQQLLWQQRQEITTTWLNTLTHRANSLQDILNRLSELNQTWTATRAAAQAANAPQPILQQIDEALGAIATAETPLDSQRTAVLDLQARVAREVAQCGSVLAEIDRSQQKVVSGILVRKSAIWSGKLWAGAGQALHDRVRRISNTLLQDGLEYLRDPSKGMPMHVGLLVLLTLLFRVVRWKSDQWSITGQSGSPASNVFRSPFAAALLVTLAILTIPFLQAIPLSIREMFQVLACVPIILLIRPVAGAWAMRGLYSLSFFFAIDTLRIAFSDGAPIDEAILLFEALAGFFVSAWLLAKTWRAPEELSGQAGLSILRWGASIFLLIFGVGLVCGIIGYASLASLVVSGSLSLAITAPLLYASVLVVSGLIAFALRVWPLRTLHMVQHHRAVLEKRTHRFLLWAAFVGLIVRYLDHIGLLDPALAFGKTILTSRLERGAMSISIGDILTFFLTVWAAYLLSALIRFVLEEDVYPRTRITPGRSYATSSLLHYVVLAIGFVAAIALLGVDLSKITVLAGAFSVGIGFGLQSIVNNFVSGLIVLFERPIDKGDSVEIGNLRGTVQRIGIRASVVRTFQGADIIVPNSQFIAEKVTNWTHGDRSMRIELPVGVNYATPPKKAIDVLEATARAHPEVLREPAPQVIFVGFGDSSINFELRAWTDEFANALRIRTDLASAVYDAINEAGMSFPFPQREVRLLTESKSGSPVVPADDVTAQDKLDSSAKSERDLPQKDLGNSSGEIRSLGE